MLPANHKPITNRVVGLLALSVQVCCGSRAGSTSRNNNAVSVQPRGEVIGRIGAQRITLAELQSFAHEQHSQSGRDAWGEFSSQRMLALEAIRMGQNSDPIVLEFAQRAMVQRLLEIEIEQRINPRNIPEPALVLARKTKGFALAHGPLHSVVHVLAFCRRTDTAVLVDRARAKAEAARIALLALTETRGESQIRAAVLALPDGASYRVEPISGFDASGADGTPGGFDPTFAATASQLANVDDVSPVVQTPFGFHVIVLVRRDPALVADPTLVAQTVQTEALTLARTRAMRLYLEQLRRRHNVRIMDQAGVESQNAASAP